jgi:hypothetical protein
MQPKVRLVNRKRMDASGRFDLHFGFERFLGDDTVVHLPAAQGRIIEYKAPWQHYVDQLFYEWEGSPVHEAPACRARMTPQALELGETAFRIDRRARRPRVARGPRPF